MAYVKSILFPPKLVAAKPCEQPMSRSLAILDPWHALDMLQGVQTPVVLSFDRRAFSLKRKQRLSDLVPLTTVEEQAKAVRKLVGSKFEVYRVRLVYQFWDQPLSLLLPAGIKQCCSAWPGIAGRGTRSTEVFFTG